MGGVPFFLFFLFVSFLQTIFKQFYGLKAGTELSGSGMHWFGALVTKDMINIIIIFINRVLGKEMPTACFNAL